MPLADKDIADESTNNGQRHLFPRVGAATASSPMRDCGASRIASGTLCAQAMGVNSGVDFGWFECLTSDRSSQRGWRILMTNAVPELNPSATALLLMDFQYAMVGAIGDKAATPVVANAVTALDWARANEIPVAHIRLGFEPTEAAEIPDTNKNFAPVRDAGMLRCGSPEAEIVDLVKPADDEQVFRKTRIGAFSTTSLGHWLAERNIDTLILAGITTSGVMLSTVREASDRDLRAVVLRDATADLDPVVHEVLVERVFPATADVVSTAELTTRKLAQ
jgi:nicotinamidase-related amidase